jgi:hypothetical protein
MPQDGGSLNRMQLKELRCQEGYINVSYVERLFLSLRLKKLK